MRLLEFERGDGGGDLKVSGGDIPVLSGGVDEIDDVDELDEEGTGVFVERDRIELFTESLFLLFLRDAFLSMHGEEVESFFECFSCEVSSSSSCVFKGFVPMSPVFFMDRFVLVDFEPSISFFKFSKII